MAIAPLHQDQAAIGDRERRARVLLHQHDRDAARADLRQPREHALHQFGRQAGGGLVQHQHPRRGDQRARDRRHLALSAGQPARGQASLACEIGKEAIDFGDAAGALGGGQNSRRQPEIVLDRHPREDVIGLRHEREAPANHAMSGQARDLFLAEKDGPRRDRRDARDRLDQRRFSRAVGAEHRDDLACLGRQGGAVDDRHAGLVTRHQISHGQGAHASLLPLREKVAR